MLKNLSLAILVASVSADDTMDFVDQAVNSKAVDFNGEPVESLAQAPVMAVETSPVVSYPEVSLTSTASGDGIFTPAIHGPNDDGPAKTGYKVPNFGVDRDIIATNKHIADTERKLKHKWIPLKNKDGPKDYFVPNFGLDKDIIESGKSIVSTERALNKEWNPKQDKDGNWIVPEPIDNTSYSYMK